jgi:hypothetical protein
MENPDADQPVVMVAGTYVTDPPTPELEELEQRDPPAPAVPVTHQGTLYVVRQPALKSAVFSVDLDTTMRRVVDRDPRRSAVTLVSDTEWRMSATLAGSGAPIPANTPIRLEHAAAIYARVASSTATLTVIQEVYGD